MAPFLRVFYNYLTEHFYNDPKKVFAPASLAECEEGCVLAVVFGNASAYAQPRFSFG